jgi:hypothetical protein
MDSQSLSVATAHRHVTAVAAAGVVMDAVVNKFALFVRKRLLSKKLLPKILMLPMISFAPFVAVPQAFLLDGVQAAAVLNDVPYRVKGLLLLLLKVSITLVV